MSEEKKIDIDESVAVSEESAPVPQPERPTLPPHKEYAKRMLNFSDFYIGFIAIVGIIMALAVAIAVIYSVALGVAIALFGVFFYVNFLPDNMSKILGFRYVSLPGGIRLTMCRARYGEVMWVPDRLMWFDVIAIGEGAFSSPKNSELKKVFLPKTLTEIGKDIFAGCDALEDIYYQGTAEEFSKIKCETDLSAYRMIFDAKYPPMLKKKKPARAAKKK